MSEAPQEPLGNKMRYGPEIALFDSEVSDILRSVVDGSRMSVPKFRRDCAAVNLVASCLSGFLKEYQEKVLATMKEPNSCYPPREFYAQGVRTLVCAGITLNPKAAEKKLV